MAIRQTIINGSSKVWLARVVDQGRRRSLLLGVAIATMLLAFTVPASGEMPVQSWLDFYSGNSRTVPISVARVMAGTYTLGMADGFISTQVVSCPTGYSPEGDVIARRAANMLTAQPKASVTAAVLAALTIDGCTGGPSAKGSVR